MAAGLGGTETSIYTSILQVDIETMLDKEWQREPLCTQVSSYLILFIFNTILLFNSHEPDSTETKLEPDSLDFFLVIEFVSLHRVVKWMKQ